MLWTCTQKGVYCYEFTQSLRINGVSEAGRIGYSDLIFVLIALVLKYFCFFTKLEVLQLPNMLPNSLSMSFHLNFLFHKVLKSKTLYEYNERLLYLKLSQNINACKHGEYNYKSHQDPARRLIAKLASDCACSLWTISSVVYQNVKFINIFLRTIWKK